MFDWKHNKNFILFNIIEYGSLFSLNNKNFKYNNTKQENTIKELNCYKDKKQLLHNKNKEIGKNNKNFLQIFKIFTNKLTKYNNCITYEKKHSNLEYIDINDIILMGFHKETENAFNKIKYNKNNK